jgi:hypothetical protein
VLSFRSYRLKLVRRRAAIAPTKMTLDVQILRTILIGFWA